MKKFERNGNSELQEVKIKKRSRVVKDKKKGGVRLKRWTKRHTLRALLPVCMLAILIVGVFSLGSFGNSEKNEVDLGFVTVSYPVPEDGTTPLDHTGIENIGYMNARLMAQTKYYAEMHSAVDTIVPQTVDTYKQFSNGVLVQSDIAKSSLINDAQQFCFTGDDVIWRNASGSVSTWNGLDTPWKTGAPAGHMKVEDFKQKVGLPGTEFSVYVLREETILNADPVVDHGNGTFTQTFYLDTSPDKAPMYYMNQMIFKGGLAAPPAFDYITVSYTFDSTWQVLACDIEEKYTATKKGIPLPATCVSTSHTEYEYGTDRANHTAYDSYFKNYVDAPVVTEPVEDELTAVECLGAAFSSVLTEPTVFSLALDLNGVKLNGAVYVDVNQMDIRARLGEISVYYGGDGVYLAWGNVKLKTTVEELTGLIGGLLPSAGEGAGFELDTDALLAELVKNDLVIEGSVASLSAELNLFGMVLPIDFRFLIGEDAVSLGDVNTRIALGDFVVGATLAFGNEEIAALTQEEKSEYIEVVPYAEKLIGLLGAETLGVDLEYSGEGFSVAGNVNASVKNGLRAAGTLAITVGGQSLPLSFGFEENEVYLNLSGIKLRAGVEETVALIMELLGVDETAPKLEFDLNRILTTVLSPEFIANIAVTEQDGNLQVVLKGTELLNLLGIGFDLGEVKLTVSEEKLSVGVLGAAVAIGKGEAFEVEKEGYVEILPYAKQLIALFTGEALAVTVDYAQGELVVRGDLTVNLKEFAVGGTLTVAYENISQTVLLAWIGREVYVCVGDLKIKASAETIGNLIAELTGDSLSINAEAKDLLADLLALDFGKLIELTESDGALNIRVFATELLRALGLDFGLGTVELSIKDGKITANALGAAIGICAGEKYESGDLSGYLDLAPVVPYVGALKDLFTSEVLHADIAYASEELIVRGGLDFALKNEIRASGSIAVTIGQETLSVGIGYEKEALYLDLAGIKLSGKTNELLAFVQDLFPKKDGNAKKFDLGGLLQTLFSKETLSCFEISERENALRIAIRGTELLNAFGIEYDLGDVVLSVSEGKFAASLLGASAEVRKGEAFEVETEGYTDIVPYAQQLKALFTGEAVAVKAEYAQGELAVHGNLILNLKEFGVLGELSLQYGEIRKNAAVLFENGELFLAVDGLRVKLDSAQIGELLGGVIPSEGIDGAIGTILSLDFGKLFAVSEQGGALEILIAGGELLRAFGIDFDLGEIRFGVEGGKLTVGALGANLEIVATEAYVSESEAYAPFADAESFADITGIVKQIPSVIDTGALQFGGELSFDTGDMRVSAKIENGAVRWKGGFKVYLDLVLDLNGVLQKISVSADSDKLEFAYGQIGARVEFGSLQKLDEAFVELYRRIKSVADQAFESDSPLPENVESVLDLLKLLTKSMPTGGNGFGVSDFVNELVIGAPVSENGICTLAWKGVTLELTNASGDTLCGIDVSYTDSEKGLALVGGLTAGVLKSDFPEMPAIEYLGINDFIETLDYVGAAVETLARQDITINIEGETVSGDASVCSVTGTALYHAGSRFPFHINTDTKDFYVNPDLYFYLDLKIAPQNDGATGTYLELWIFDFDGNDELDFFVSLSRFADGKEGRNPLRFHARAGELMTVLSEACALLGLNGGVVNDYLVSKWLVNVQTAEQLRAIGDMLKKSLGLEDLLGGLIAGASPSVAETNEEKQAVAYITALAVGKTELKITLNSSAIFGGEDLNDLEIKLTKAQGEDGNSYLTGFTLANIYGNGNSEVTSVGIGISYAPISESDYIVPNPDDKYTELEGIGKLFETLAASATHTETNECGDDLFALNQYYYISGKATVKAKLLGASMLSVNLDPLALSVRIDDGGAIGLNVRIGYPAVIGMIDGGCTLDISIRGDMIYLRRVQTTEMSGTSEKKLASPVTIYRAMPISVFASDIMEQLAWMLHLSDTIKDQMTKGGSSESTEQAIVDYGTLFENYVTGAVWNRENNSWLLTLNGKGLTNGVIGDIFVGLNTDARGYLRDLSVNTSINYGVVVDISANLTFRNPGEEVKLPVDDVTDNISYLLESGMNKAIRHAAAMGWKDEAGKAIFVEGQLVNVNYMIGDTVVESQKVLVDKSTGELLADLSLPDLNAFAINGFHAEWDLGAITQADGSYRLTADTNVEVRYTPNRYTITFLSEKPIAGFGEALQYVEQAGGSYYALAVTYVYADGFYLENGEKWSIPEAENAGWYLASFTDGAKEYRTQSDFLTVASDLWLTAQWEMSEYTVTYTIEGVRYEQTAHYGESFACPASTDRDGYDFLGWQCGDSLLSPETLHEMFVEGSVELVAVYSPKAFTVRLVSEYQIDGSWNALPEGGFVKEIVYLYGERTALDSEIHLNGLFLDGFVFDLNDEEEHAKTFVPDTVLCDTTMYAKWSEARYQITFIADGEKVAVQNYGEGDGLKNLPAVPQKVGYSGIWGVASDYTVTGDDTVYATYTANTFEIAVYSEYPLNGFIESDKGFVRTYRYTYDCAEQAFELPVDYKVAKNDFGGYYTKRNGEGDRIERIDNGIVGISELYIWWQDNTVTVNLYSNVRIDGFEYTMSEGKVAYKREMIFNDEYSLATAPQTEKYQQLGWTCRSEDGSWRFIESVRNYNGKDIWAVWIENLSVTVNDLSQSGLGIGSLQLKSFNVGGTYTGGEIFGEKGKQIAAEIGIELVTTAEFKVYGKQSDQVDTLNGGDEIVIGNGSFKKTGMMAGSPIGWGGAKYGGVCITMNFNYTVNGEKKSIPTRSAYYATFDTYTVTYKNPETDETIGEVSGIRAGCPYAYVDGVKVENGKYVDEVARIPAPEKRGYTGAWAHVEITSNATVYPVYTANTYGVRFVSAQKLEGWNYDAANDTYYIVRDMKYDSKVYLYEGTALVSEELLPEGQGNPFTVTDGNNLVVLPKFDTGRLWTRYEISADEASFYSYNKPDTVTFKSDIAYAVNGAARETVYTEEFENAFTLPAANEISAEGYTFLGWYQKTDGGWKQVTELTYSRGQAIDTAVEALWQKTALTITSFTGKRSGYIGSKAKYYYDYDLNVTVQRSELIGAFMNESGIRSDVTYEFDIDSKLTGSSHEGKFSETVQTTSQYQQASTKVMERIYSADGELLYETSVDQTKKFKGTINASF